VPARRLAPTPILVPRLSAEQKRVYLRSSEIVRRCFEKQCIERKEQAMVADHVTANIVTKGRSICETKQSRRNAAN
jgi:hypothetical protein